MEHPRITWDKKPLRWNYVPQRIMPQVDEADQAALIEWLTWKNVSVTQVQLDPTTLLFHQHVYGDFIATMPAEIYAKPIWISSDGYVLDGNHRATAHVQRGDMIEALQLSLEFEDAVAAIFSFAGTYDYAEKKK